MSLFERYGLASAADFRGPVSIAADGGWSTLFLWQGPEASLEFESLPSPVALSAVDSGWWYAEIALPERFRVTYQFRVGEELHADPLNPVGAGGDRSIAATPDVPPQPHWPSLGAEDVVPLPKGRIRWASAILGGRRTVRVHPVDGGGPLVLLLDGDDWLHLHPVMLAFGSAVAAGDLPPVTLVYLPTVDREAEFGCNPEFWRAIRNELLPLLAEAGFGSDRLVVAGQSLAGLSAVYAALEFPDLVTRVACQSGSFWWTPEAIGSADPLGGPEGGAIAERLKTETDLSRLRIAFDVGEHETRMLPHCDLVESLVAAAGADVRISRSPSGHDRAGWREALLRDVAWALG
ncbi:enterochelin esterase [Pseudonocardiaceae bacterium YIM PH 21723]|nr:enterochelin esterase [Pseudonocardiaceae bacterium YIM PH 21723]